MKNSNFLAIAFIAIAFAACSKSDNPTNDDSGQTANLTLENYVQTFPGSGDVVTHYFDNGRWTGADKNGENGLDLEYDNEGRIIRLVEYANGGVWDDLKFHYDSSGKMSSVEQLNLDGDAYITRSVEYSGNKINIQRIAYNEGTIQLSFDGDMNITGFDEINAYDELLHSEKYRYDEQGNIAEVEYFHDYSFYQDSGVLKHTYDTEVNPMFEIYADNQLPIMIWGTENIFFRYKITDFVKTIGPNNRIATVYPENYPMDYQMNLENEYYKGYLSKQTLKAKATGEVSQTVEFNYRE